MSVPGFHMMRVIRSRGREGRTERVNLSVPRARARIMSQTTVSALPRRLLSGVSDTEQRFFSNDNNIMMIPLSVRDMCLQISRRSRKIYLRILFRFSLIKYFSRELFTSVSLLPFAIFLPCLGYLKSRS